MTAADARRMLRVLHEKQPKHPYIGEPLTRVRECIRAQSYSRKIQGQLLDLEEELWAESRVRDLPISPEEYEAWMLRHLLTQLR